jgi:hypothetical protein
MTVFADTDASPVSDNQDLSSFVSTSAAEEAQDANPAQSSSADETDAKQEGPADLSDVVRRVVEKKEEPKEEPSTSEAKSETESEAEAEDEDDPDAEVPFHKHPRWQQMKSERDKFKADAEAYHSMQDFMQTSNLTGEEVAVGFDVMALIKQATTGDLGAAEQARVWFAERLNVFDEMLGNSLPEDLQQKVNDGFVDEDIAKELAKERAKARNLENLRTQDTQKSQAERQAEAEQANRMQVAQAVQSWEDGIKAKDPDYATKKAKLVETQVRALIQQNGAMPQTAAEARALAEQAYAEVDGQLKALMPRPRAVTPSPTGMSARVSTAPKSLGDAVRAALNR